MKCYLKEERNVPLSSCDLNGRMSVPHIFAACQDIATKHAEIIGMGLQAMSGRGLFWLTARTRIRFYKRPALLRAYTLETWPHAPGSARCDRFYRASDGSEKLFEGRTEWCIWDVRAGKARNPIEEFDPSIEYSEETVLDEPYARFKHDFTDEDRVMEYTVLPSDIDVGKHMNNVAYPRLLVNSFPAEQTAKMPLKEMELLFMMPCLEGDRLSVTRRETQNGYEFGIRRADGRWAALASMTLEK